MNTVVPVWLAVAQACASLEVRATFRIFDSFYFGPRSRFTADEWLTMRAALPVRELPLVEGKLLLASPAVSTIEAQRDLDAFVDGIQDTVGRSIWRGFEARVGEA